MPSATEGAVDFMPSTELDCKRRHQCQRLNNSSASQEFGCSTAVFNVDDDCFKIITPAQTFFRLRFKLISRRRTSDRVSDFGSHKAGHTAVFFLSNALLGVLFSFTNENEQILFHPSPGV